MSLSTSFVSLSIKLNISWPGVAERWDDQWNWLPECEQGPCRSRCIPNSRESNQGVAVGGRKWFSKFLFRQGFGHFRQGGCIGDFLRVSLVLIQGQYKVALQDAKYTVWAAKGGAIFTFSITGAFKTS